jgi:hypothetical protein
MHIMNAFKPKQETEKELFIRIYNAITEQIKIDQSVKNDEHLKHHAENGCIAANDTGVKSIPGESSQLTSESNSSAKIAVEFSHRLHFSPGIYPIDLERTIWDMTSRAISTLTALVDLYFSGPNGSEQQINNEAIYFTINSVILELKDISEVVNTYDDLGEPCNKELIKPGIVDFEHRLPSDTWTSCITMSDAIDTMALHAHSILDILSDQFLEEDERTCRLDNKVNFWTINAVIKHIQDIQKTVQVYCLARADQE